MSEVSFERFSQEFAKELEIEGSGHTCLFQDLEENSTVWARFQRVLVIEELFNFQIDLEV